MSNTFLVSVIVPNYNHAPYLKERIDSILNQTYAHFEVILLDDCSTDNSSEILNKYAHHPKVSHCIINTRNSGSPFLQWKKGIDLATGDLIWIAESDDWAELNFLETLVERFINRDDLVLAFCLSRNMLDKNTPVKEETERSKYLLKTIWKESFEMNAGELLPYFLPDNSIVNNASAALFQREIGLTLIDSLIGYRTIGDFLFWTQISLKGAVSFKASYLNYRRRTSSGVVSATNHRQIKHRELQKIHWLLFKQNNRVKRYSHILFYFHYKHYVRRLKRKIKARLNLQLIF